VTGHVPGAGKYQASLEGTGFGIEIAATSDGRQQLIDIVSQGTDVKSVKIVLRKT
jgi:dihydroxyacetone kinase